MSDAHAEAVIQAAQARAAALTARDADGLRRLLHVDLRWTTFRGEVLDRESYVQGNTAGELTWLDQRLEDVSVSVVGDTAVLVGVVVDTVQREGAPRRFRLRLTQTWVRTGDEWLCLAGHAGPEVADGRQPKIHP